MRSGYVAANKRTHRPAFGVAEQRGPLASDCIHDRPHVVHAGLEIGQPDTSIRQPRPALVEADQPREGSKPAEEARQLGVFPLDLEVREESGDEHEVERPAARDLVRDVDVPALRVPDPIAHGRCPV